MAQIGHGGYAGGRVTSIARLGQYSMIGHGGRVFSAGGTFGFDGGSAAADPFAAGDSLAFSSSSPVSNYEFRVRLEKQRSSTADPFRGTGTDTEKLAPVSGHGQVLRFYSKRPVKNGNWMDWKSNYNSAARRSSSLRAGTHGQSMPVLSTL